MDSLDVDEQVLVAFALLNQQKFAVAELAFAKAYQSGATGVTFHEQYAQLYLAQNNIIGALNEFDRALSFAPNNLSILHDQAAALFLFEDWVEAAKVYRRLKKWEPNNPKVISMLGTCYLEMEEPVNALRLYENYLPHLGTSRYDRDILYDCGRIARYRLNDLLLAESYFEKLTQLFPNFWEGQQELVQLYNIRKKFFSAEAIILKAAYAYEKGDLPDAWQKSGYWMTDELVFDNHRVHIYASLLQDDKYPAFKLFILDLQNQHVRGKVEVFPTSADRYLIKLKTTLVERDKTCVEVADYAVLRSCIRSFLTILD